MIYLFGKHVCLTVVSYVYIFKSLLGSILGKRETYDKHPDYVPSLFLVYGKKGNRHIDLIGSYKGISGDQKDLNKLQVGKTVHSST